MELIRIGDSKLKITLTSDDMTQYELDCDTMDYGNSETRKAFWAILDRARDMTGFDAAGNRVFVQLYPDKKGGCEIYITKLDILCADKKEREGERLRASLPRGTSHAAPTAETALLPRGGGERDRMGAYRFEHMGDLLRVCRQLATRGYAAHSSAYRDERDRYYLLLRERATAFGVSCGEFSFIAEFGTPENAEAVRLYISEHGAPICEGDAVAVLSRC